MKIKTLICASALSAAAFGTDVVTGANICGLISVPSPDHYTMIAAPWITVGAADSTGVPVCDFVKKDTLQDGDALFYYDGSAWKSWQLSGCEWTGVIVSGKGGISPTAGAGDFSLPRGKGLWIYRQNTANEIWLYGQYKSAAPSVAVTAGSSGTPAYTIVANPTTTDKDLNTAGVTGAAGDRIAFPSDNGLSKFYEWNGSAWETETTTQKTLGGKTFQVKSRTTTGCVIPAGKGAWYISKGGSPTITW